MSITTYIKRNIDAILVSLVLNVNVLRYFLYIRETNLLLYSIYIFCIIALWYKNKKRLFQLYRKDHIIKYDINYWMLLLSLSTITSVVITGELAIFFKFLVASIIGLLCIGENIQKSKTIFIWFYAVNVLYGIILLLSPERAISYMKALDVNYLNITLTLGFCFTISLVEIVQGLYCEKKKTMLLASVSSLFFFLVLMIFAARGVLLFPPLIMLFTAFIKRGRNKRKFFLLLGLMTVMVLCAVEYFLQNMSGFALAHMTRLFDDAGEESRIDLWIQSLDTIVNNLWIFWGAGFNGFGASTTFYPHNIFIQTLGDFGILGLLGFSLILYYVLKRGIKYYTKTSINSSGNLSILCLAGVLYYLLTFCKSFSMYDSCPLLIMISLCLSVTSHTVGIRKGKNNSQYVCLQ